MQHRVSTEEQLNDMQRQVEEGLARFVVKEATEKTSQSSQKEMIELKLEVTEATGAKGTVYDYLIPDSKMAFKLKHFWDSVGEAEIYAQGETYAANYEGKKGRCELKWQKSKNTAYQDRMAVDDYIVNDSNETVETTASPEPTNGNYSDDIPF